MDIAVHYCMSALVEVSEVQWLRAGLLVNRSRDGFGTRGMIHNTIHLVSPGCPRTSAESYPKTAFISIRAWLAFCRSCHQSYRYVIIQMLGYKSLILCEVEVYGFKGKARVNNLGSLSLLLSIKVLSLLALVPHVLAPAAFPSL